MELLAVQQARDVLLSHDNTKLVESSWKSITYEGKGVYAAGDEKFFLDETAMHQMLREMGMNNASFIFTSDKLKEMLVDEVLTSDRKLGMLIDENNNATRFMNMECPYLKPLTIFDRIIAVIGNDKNKTRIQLETHDGQGVLMNFITHDTYEVKEVGDTVHAGICVKTQMSSMRPELSMGPFAYTLQCSNGLVGKIEDIRLIEALCTSDIFELIELSVANILAAARSNLIPQLIHLTRVAVKDPSRFIRQISKEFRLRSTVMIRMMDRIPALGEEPTLYAVVNFITSEANQYKLPVRMKLQEIGGHIAETAGLRCPTCHNVL